MPRLAVFALVVCALAVAAAVVSFAQGSWLGIVWILMAGISSNMAWFYVRKAKMERAGEEGAAEPTAAH
ncbi:hypothetical protein ADK70_20580 [Streptomyces rimosus subsp. pseudoverticillatus]|uniref:hypothetical protein n=1 Tax=Streptomyces rimosus TaxID=1927 RepID=UPI0006B27E3C|nr:hypothetical protein [Streptomyces rimosus]KOT86383.1 hypothetical protein ADK70_20580 [Streptomyces rimosus subsp. pseudoverticillatus]